MPKGIPRQGHVAIGVPEGDKRRPIIRAERACSRVKQSHDLDFFTAKPTSPLPPLPGCQFFMKFRGPAAHPNRVERAPYVRRRKPLSNVRGSDPSRER